MFVPRFFDEPFTDLDPRTHGFWWENLKRLGESKTVILFSSSFDNKFREQVNTIKNLDIDIGDAAIYKSCENLDQPLFPIRHSA